MFRYEVTKFSDATAAAYMARKISSNYGFSKSAQIEIAISVSELATNIVKYAGRGELEFGFEDGAFHVYSRNKGAGLENIELAFTDHCTDSMKLTNDDIFYHNGRGVGLSAVRRLMDDCLVSQSSETGLLIKASKKLS